ncbi:hypothetical protein TNIN_126291 [Trichonephila inaurata madagascariensis]|uniref:Uncharacterized protein n=1 Tax=Trichonephila inaurata madagascariensis TaxID=2747483 RepID=A0A8X6XNH0_9ARAC|nr:hypothetical protein TNIN_126291 [Trichonephila inaurata madagascariensis]
MSFINKGFGENADNGSLDGRKSLEYYMLRVFTLCPVGMGLLRKDLKEEQTSKPQAYNTGWTLYWHCVLGLCGNTIERHSK